MKEESFDFENDPPEPGQWIPASMTFFATEPEPPRGDWKDEPIKPAKRVSSPHVSKGARNMPETMTVSDYIRAEYFNRRK